jgi:L-aminopeptidase/D-esterase-like protein
MAAFFAAPPGAGSVIAVVATDAPLLAHQCSALARRVTLGLARTGTTGSHFSGDLFLAFSTANLGAFTPGFRTIYAREGRYDELRFVPWGFLDRFCEATVRATEEAVIDALVANEEMVGIHGHRTPALPRDRVVQILREKGVIVDPRSART